MADRKVLSLADARQRRELREAAGRAHAERERKRRPTLAEIMDGPPAPDAA